MATQAHSKAPADSLPRLAIEACCVKPYDVVLQHEKPSTGSGSLVLRPPSDGPDDSRGRQYLFGEGAIEVTCCSQVCTATYHSP